jgi:hypothetical protein
VLVNDQVSPDAVVTDINGDGYVHLALRCAPHLSLISRRANSLAYSKSSQARSGKLGSVPASRRE